MIASMIHHQIWVAKLIYTRFTRSKTMIRFHTSKTKLGRVILHLLWKFLVPLASQDHNSLFNRFRIWFPHLVGANSRWNGCFSCSPFLSLLSSTKTERNEEKWAKMKDKRTRKKINQRAIGWWHLSPPKPYKFFSLSLTFLATNFSHVDKYEGGIFCSISDKLVWQESGDQVVRSTGSARDPPVRAVFLKN